MPVDEFSRVRRRSSRKWFPDDLESCLDTPKVNVAKASQPLFGHLADTAAAGCESSNSVEWKGRSSNIRTENYLLFSDALMPEDQA